MGRITFNNLQGEEALKLDELFGIKDCLIEVNPGRVILPPEYKDIGQRIKDMEVRPDDVWLVSYPRSGSTWAQEMVWLIGHDFDYEAAKTMQTMRTPLLEFSAILVNHHDTVIKEIGDSVSLISNMPSPRFIKTHLPLELLPRQIDEVKPKMVYVARNPKDMCVSYYHYCQLIHNLQGSFEDFCELYLKGRTPIGPIWNHILGFWERRNDPNILFLKYEDMKKDQEGAIRQTAAFLNIPITDEQVAVLADHLSFNKFKNNPAVNLDPIINRDDTPAFLKREDIKFIRKGQVGDYKNHMSPDMIKRFDSWTEENTRGTGLTFEVPAN